MIYRGQVWLSIGRWARQHGMSRDTAKRHLQVGGCYMGRLVYSDSYSGWSIVRIRGYDVLLREVNGRVWAYLPSDAPPSRVLDEVLDEEDVSDSGVARPSENPLADQLLSLLRLSGSFGR